MRRFDLISLFLVTVALAGCDLLGDSTEKIAAAREAEGKAVGGACRHAGRAIEDCYALNKKADKASVFAGWRDMNDYMRENKIDAVPPQLGSARTEAKSAESKGGDAQVAEAKSEGKAGEGAAEPAEKPKAKGHEGKGHDS